MTGALRLLFVAFAALLLLGAAPEPSVEYRLGVEPPSHLRVEVRFRGDRDGETRLVLPDTFASGKEFWRFVEDLRVKGASVAEDGPGARILRHRPNAKLTVAYRVRSPYDADPDGKDGNPYRGVIVRPDWFAVLGEHAFAYPEGRAGERVTFRWRRLPRNWKAASDLEHGALGAALTVDDVPRSISVGGARFVVLERPVAGGALRLAAPQDGPVDVNKTADEAAAIVSAQRGYWNDMTGPYLVAVVPLTAKERWASTGGTGRRDAFALYVSPRGEGRVRWTLAHEHLHTWNPVRLGRMPRGEAERAAYWFSEGLTNFLTVRTLVRAGLFKPDEALAEMSNALKAYDDSPARNASAEQIVKAFWTDRPTQDVAYQRGALLALKWDEEIRRKSGGKLDLDDVLFRMRDHYRQFAPGQGPDVETGLVSAAWVVAQADLRPDIARYAVKGETVPLPDSFFGGCVELRAFTRPGFDSGFDHQASAAANVVRGVRRGGPAWTSGLRDGMRIRKMDLRVGDTSREIVLEVQPARGRARTIRYWPYGDNDLETRTLVLRDDLDEAAKAACARRIAGL